MEKVFGNGIKLIVPEETDASILFSCTVDGDDNITGMQRGTAIDLLVMSLNQIDEMLKILPRPLRKQYAIGIAEVLSDSAEKIDGLDVVKIKRVSAEDDADGDEDD